MLHEYMRENPYLKEKLLGNARVECTYGDYLHSVYMRHRRLFLHGDIESLSSGCETISYDYNGQVFSMTSAIVDDIMKFNHEDYKVPADRREPIWLYINSPGGEITEGFALVDAISMSKTPVYTVNMGQWSSIAFLIGITGKKRFSLPHATFLMHDDSTGMFGSASKVQDQVDFEERFSQQVIRTHVLRHSRMSEKEYDDLACVEYYMLPSDAISHGFIDEIITSLDDILFTGFEDIY